MKKREGKKERIEEKKGKKRRELKKRKGKKERIEEKRGKKGEN